MTGTGTLNITPPGLEDYAQLLKKRNSEKEKKESYQILTIVENYIMTNYYTQLDRYQVKNSQSNKLDKDLYRKAKPKNLIIIYQTRSKIYNSAFKIREVK
ncbi:hypothetical protein FNJ88_02945 [Chryseobacterium sp. SNU WT5]|nr:hypothetical protein FNJ88_02945 [Chryseobacterium sp. SNU WT5]